MSHFSQPNIEKKEMCVDNEVWETIGDFFCPTCRSEKCVYISTNKTTSFYDCKKCKACCNTLNIPFRDQKPTFMLFGGDGTHCFARKTSPEFVKQKQSPCLKNFLRQSQPNTSEPGPKNVKMSPNMERTLPFPIGWWFEWQNQFSNHFIQFQSSANRWNLINLHSTYIQLTEIHDLLSLQRRNLVGSLFFSRLCY